MSEFWIINASPTILLAKVGLIEIVPKLTNELVIPQPVVLEILNVAGRDAAADWLNGLGKNFIRPAVIETPSLAGSQIGPGERAVISWAVAHPGFFAVLDDLEARHVGQRLGIKVIGTVGIILRLKKAGLISEAKSYLQKIRKAGGYIGDNLFCEALKQVGENS